MSAGEIPDRQVFVHRTRPESCFILVEPGHAALVVTRGVAGKLLGAGRHRIRHILAPIPEVYTYRTGGHFFPIQLTGLASSDGEPFDLGWRVQLKVHDAHKLWGAWLNTFEGDEIPLPTLRIGAALADCTYDLTREYSLEDLRKDAQVRDRVAGKMSLLLHKILEPLGLLFAAEFAPSALRVQTIADRAAAEKELRESLIDGTMESLTDYDMLVHRLRETLDKFGVLLSEQKLAALASQIATKQVSVAEAIEFAIAHKDDLAAAAMPPAAQPAQPELAQGEPVSSNRWRAIGALCRMIAGVGFATAMYLAIRFEMAPADLLADEHPWRKTAILAGIIAGSILAAWLGTHFMKTAALQARNRLEHNAHIDVPAAVNKELHWRNFAIILGAVAAIAAILAGFILPEYTLPARVVATLLGLGASLVIVRWNFLYQGDRSLANFANTRRRAHTAKASREQQQRAYAQGVAELKGELNVLHNKVGEVASLAYWVLENQRPTGELRVWEKTIVDLAARVDEMPAAPAKDDRTAPGDNVAAVERLATTLSCATKSATALSSTMRQARTSGRRADAASVQHGIDALVETLSHFRDDMIRSLSATH